MGNNCSCLSNITSLCSEDLSRQGNNEGINTYINNNPKVNLSNYALSEKYDPMIIQKNSLNDINSTNSNQISQKNKKNLILIIIIKKIITLLLRGKEITTIPVKKLLLQIKTQI